MNGSLTAGLPKLGGLCGRTSPEPASPPEMLSHLEIEKNLFTHFEAFLPFARTAIVCTCCVL